MLKSIQGIGMKTGDGKVLRDRQWGGANIEGKRVARAGRRRAIGEGSDGRGLWDGGHWKTKRVSVIQL